MSGSRSGQSYSLNYLLYGDISSTKFEDETWEFDSKRDNRFDAGLIAGAGITLELYRGLSLFAEGRYYYGLTDMQKQYMTFMVPHYNSTLAIQGGISYTFGH